MGELFGSSKKLFDTSHNTIDRTNLVKFNQYQIDAPEGAGRRKRNLWDCSVSWHVGTRHLKTAARCVNRMCYYYIITKLQSDHCDVRLLPWGSLCSFFGIKVQTTGSTLLIISYLKSRDNLEVKTRNKDGKIPLWEKRIKRCWTRRLSTTEFLKLDVGFQ